MNKKYLKFLENAKELNENFGIIPLLYGSLGLELLTQTDLLADDIDILIPEVYVKGISWNDFKAYLEAKGYVLVDEHEHTFRKEGIDYSYANIENLEEFAGIKLEDIQVQSNSNIQYLLLTLEQYLAVYKKSATDGYRVNKKEKKDNEKILFINEQIEKKNNKTR